MPDFAAAREFHRGVFGLGEALCDLPAGGRGEFATGGPGNLAVIRAEDGYAPSEGTTVILDIAECREAWRVLRGRRVRCDDPVDLPGFATFCSFYDPFGNRLKISSPLPAE